MRILLNVCLLAVATLNVALAQTVEVPIDPLNKGHGNGPGAVGAVEAQKSCERLGWRNGHRGGAGKNDGANPAPSDAIGHANTIP